MKPIAPLFSLLQNPPPQIQGKALADVFHGLSGTNGPGLRFIYGDILKAFKLDPAAPLARAGMSMADLIDTPTTGPAPNYGGHGNHFHNRRHMLEVLVSAAVLLAVHDQRGFDPKFTPFEKTLLLTAALGHDLGHDGRGNGLGDKRVPLLNETRSLLLADDIIAPHYGPGRRADYEEDFALYRALLVSTDIGGGKNSPSNIFNAVVAFTHTHKTVPAPVTPEDQHFMSMMEAYPHLPELSALLQDADILPSTAASPEWAERQERTLAQELKTRRMPDGDVNWKDALWFRLNLAAPKSLAGQTFASNRAEINAHIKGLAESQPG